MRKFFCLLFCVLLVSLLSACGEPPTLSASFDKNFTVTQGDTEYSGTLAVNDDGIFVTFTAPYTVSGLRFDYTSQGLSISRNGLTTAVNCDYIPAFAVPSVLHNTLTYLPQATYTTTDGNVDSFTLPTPYGEATVTATSGEPTTLTDPYSDLTFTFSSQPAD